MSDKTDRNGNLRVPVAIVSGFLGAGKTTLIDRLLNNRGDLRVSTLINDLGEGGSDGRLMRGVQLNGHSHVVQLKNGCICCSLRDELAERIADLAKSGEIDYILVEATGIAEPLPVAANFFSEDEEGLSLESLVRIDAAITVVDALNFPLDYERSDTLANRRLGVTSGDDRNVSDVLAEQVEFASILVINKSDLVSTEALERLEAILEQLNPDATRIVTTHGIAPVTSLMNTRSFDFETVSQASGWQRALAGKEPPENSELDIYVYRARRPFHPGRLWDVLRKPVDGVIRAKGFFWLASRHNHAGIWSQAGSTFRDDLAGRWWSSLPREEWPEEASAQDEIDRLHEEPYGDRRQELAFIGKEVDSERLSQILDACLLDDVEMSLGQLGWESFADPFSVWWDDDEGEISGSENVPSA